MEYIIDVKNKKLGRVASEIAVILQGKKSVSYEPRFLGADSVRVKNISELTISGSKFEEKKYYKHAGPLGHLKERKFADIFAERPEWILRHAVNLMLPKNKLRAKRMRKIIIEK
ncbi:50S ribosomal protein L13 [Candidatus Jorgensenbacteria bacterium RIFCSPLOWO2_02_FULL_45_12]|uniref:50S ribosomal protein L13 n=2 Tax=Candidatus Joergenseniibacteriota TaxID=1752739 RepID=A0A1F6BPF3_9BACT|nr:MAG: 50S ribosomal protein L13 [Candidatus Jorgensenbacteria bacterium GW2011_GWA2_45_9]OGG38642.1 MAG: 50S ribosomal protein L13 [Candidatus Jorgensenbacteria bacterium RIFCSPHIGHO2_02_FULL_45_20]OGG42578.1 MAG: 50S ribosomal protein L13 [Candidatus Jorgensenbacteria bacterium RIFCSPLOWO2_02_FULL_45_12]